MSGTGCKNKNILHHCGLPSLLQLGHAAAASTNFHSTTPWDRVASSDTLKKEKKAGPTDGDSEEQQRLSSSEKRTGSQSIDYY